MAARAHDVRILGLLHVPPDVYVRHRDVHGATPPVVVVVVNIHHVDRAGGRGRGRVLHGGQLALSPLADEVAAAEEEPRARRHPLPEEEEEGEEKEEETYPPALEPHPPPGPCPLVDRRGHLR